MFKKILPLLFTSLLFTSCYSIFSGATGGVVVDAESTTTPKAVIANVDVYAYTSEKDRDSDFSKWTEGTTFEPHAEYYGHTTTGADGSFVISKLVWKKGPAKSSFGKDADTQLVYLLFYHEDYGLTKGSTLIVSDSTSDSVYAELTAIRKSTNLIIKIMDISTNTQTTIPLFVSISVPQTTEANTEALPIVYKQTITGTGTVKVTYPRWQNEEDKKAGKETTPAITIQYYHSTEKPEWAGCYNADNAAADYSFRADAKTGISKVIQNDIYTLNLYGKATKINMPVISGTYGSSSIAADGSANDGILLSLKRKDSAGNYTIDCGEVTTHSQTIGASTSVSHGIFSGLGTGYYWFDTTYTGKYINIDARIFKGSDEKNELHLRSDTVTYTVQVSAQ